MDFINLAQERYSMRKFSKKTVEKQKLDIVLKAGQLAPTACNNQPQRVLVIESDEALSKLKKCTQYHFDAPLALLVCYDSNETWKRKYDGDDSGVVDAGIVTTHMMLQASDLGLGTTWVGSFDPSAVIKEFKLPDNIKPVAILPMGYPADDAAPSQMHSMRKAIDKTVFYNEF